jgi:hypothetical protein
MLTSYPKAKLEDGQVESFHRSVGKRRASHQNSEHELEVRNDDILREVGIEIVQLMVMAA